MPGPLASTYSPAQFATDSAASPAAGTFTTLTLNGHVTFGADNTYNIGSNAQRVSNAYIVTANTDQVNLADLEVRSGGHVTGPSDGVFHFTNGARDAGGILSLLNSVSLGSVTNGALLGAISGYASIKNEDGGVGKIAYSVDPPASASATGFIGQIAFDSTYFYACVGTNSWRRVMHESW